MIADNDRAEGRPKDDFLTAPADDAHQDALAENGMAERNKSILKKGHRKS